MKKIIAVSVVLVVVLVLGTSAAMAVIKDSKHDFSSGSANTAKAVTFTGASLSACAFCHTPHNSNTSVTGAPLWNRTASSATYVVYTSSTFTASVTLGSGSLTCLSCHDGTIAIGDTYTGSEAATYAPGSVLVGVNDGRIASGVYAYIGENLANDHPVGFALDTSKAGLANQATMESEGAKFPSGRMECTSCHDPHGAGQSWGNTKFLRLDPATICVDCHANK